ncbi:MAG: response regulator receiver protein [Myxococcales bacterium]|nr:response regulator receiver protein [Myxococcales bacterium]
MNGYLIFMKTKEQCAVLIVDDDPDIIDAVANVLMSCWYQLRMAVDGLSALETLRDMPRQPCVVVTDLQMPGMDGFALIRAIRADERLSHVRIVVLSGIAQKAPPGADAVLAKPFEFLELRAIVSLLLDSVK